MVHEPSAVSKRKTFRKTKKKKVSQIMQNRINVKKREGNSKEIKPTKSDKHKQVKGGKEPKKASAVTIGRLTLPNVTAGIFLRGKTSTLCTRKEGIHLNPLNEARMNEKLHDILRLARNDNHSKYKAINNEKIHRDFELSRVLPAERLEEESPSLRPSPVTPNTTSKDRNAPRITMGLTSIKINCNQEMDMDMDHRNHTPAVMTISTYERKAGGNSNPHTYFQFGEFLEYLDEVSYLKRTCITDYVTYLQETLQAKSRVNTQQSLSLYSGTKVQSEKYVQDMPGRNNKIVTKVHCQEDKSLRKKQRPSLANSFQKNKNFKRSCGRKKSPDQITILGRNCGKSSTRINSDLDLCNTKGSFTESTLQCSFPSTVSFLQGIQASENNFNIPLNGISFLEQALDKSNATENNHKHECANDYEREWPPYCDRKKGTWLENDSTTRFHLDTSENLHEMSSVQRNDIRNGMAWHSSSKSSLHSDVTGHQYSPAYTPNSPCSEHTALLPRYHIPKNFPSLTIKDSNLKPSTWDLLETRLLSNRKYHTPQEMDISLNTVNQINQPSHIELAGSKSMIRPGGFEILENVDSSPMNTSCTIGHNQDLIWYRRKMF